MNNILTLKNIKLSRKAKESKVQEKPICLDKKAFEKLIEEHEEYLYKMAFIYTKNEHDALDIFQDTVYKAFLNIEKLKEPKYFKTWITKILINTFNTKSKKTVNYIDINECENKIIEISYEQLEDKIDLYDAIEKLDDKYKIPIILQYFNDLPISDIANILNSNENTIKTYLKRGKEKLFYLLTEGK